MNLTLTRLICAAGFAHGFVLIAAFMVPRQLNWRVELQALSKLNRQMHWVYGGYIVLSIAALGLISVFHCAELAAGGSLARAFCLYATIFWGGRLIFQFVFDVKAHLGTIWLRIGYHALTLLFIALTLVFGWAALRPSA